MKRDAQDTKRDQSTARAKALLGRHFLRAGYLRMPRPERLAEGYDVYKKGWEVRLVLDENELAQVRELLACVGLKVARPFRKQDRWIQPVYGEKAVHVFEDWRDAIKPQAQATLANPPKRPPGSARG